MAGRMMVMTRKGGGGSAPDTKGNNNANGGDRGDDANMDSADAEVTCPECGCQFDPEDQKNAPDDADTKGAGKGADLDMPTPTPDAQAPVGEDAVTRAVVAVLEGRM